MDLTMILPLGANALIITTTNSSVEYTVGCYRFRFDYMTDSRGGITFYKGKVWTEPDGEFSPEMKRELEPGISQMVANLGSHKSLAAAFDQLVALGIIICKNLAWAMKLDQAATDNLN